MGFIAKRHECKVPLRAHGAVAKVGAWFECDHCKREWQIQARVPEFGDREGFYKLTWISRIAAGTHTRSWMEEEYYGNLSQDTNTVQA